MPINKHFDTHTDHHHHHCSSGGDENLKSLLIVLVLTGVYMIAEFIGGYFTNSLALLADAGHMLGDVGALILSFFALFISNKYTKAKKNGHSRLEIFAALANGITLIFISFFIIYEAYERITMAQKIDALTMIAIALGGLLVNIAGALILHSGSRENLNVRGAFLHIIGDLLGSIGAIIAGVLVYKWHLYWADPVVSVLIAILVLYSSFNLIKASIGELSQ